MSASPDPIRCDLLPDERLLWSGRPRQGVIWRRGDSTALRRGLLFTGVVVTLWFAVALYTPLRTRLDFGWAGNLGVLVALLGQFGLMEWSLYHADQARRQETHLAVTSERLVVMQVDPHGRRETRSLNLDALAEAVLVTHPQGGLIRFGPPFVFTTALMRPHDSDAFGPALLPGNLPWLELGDDAPHVFEVIREAQHAAKRASRLADDPPVVIDGADRAEQR